MRNLYASRLAALVAGGDEYLKGVLKISSVKARPDTVGHLENGMSSRQAEAAAAARSIEVLALDRYPFEAPRPQRTASGFVAFDESTIRFALVQLVAALSQPRGGITRLPASAIARRGSRPPR